MIPLKLQIKNFLSYGSDVQTIDFSPYQLICLSGKNGHGKSALLDAITWVIWGQARKVSGAPKADASLLKLGQTQMMVCLDFLCNNQIYRVRREYAKTYGKPLITLDFGIVNKEQDTTITSLTDKTMKGTQQKIEQTIRLTFDAFTNSAFLRQGQANEFSKKSPKDRKEIFAQILGLQQYEEIRKLALEKAKEAIAKKAAITALQEKIETELLQAEQLDQEIMTLKTKQQEITKKEKSIQHDENKIKENKTILIEQQKKKELLLFQSKELEQKKIELEKNKNALEKKWEIIQKQRLELSNKATLEEEKKKISNIIDAHQKNLQASLDLKEQQLIQSKELHNLEKIFYEKQFASEQEKKVAVDRLQLSLESIEKKIIEQQEQINNKKKILNKLVQEIKNLQKETNQTSALEKELAKEETQLLSGKEHYQKLVAEGNITKKQLEDIIQKEQLAHEVDNPCCPLCEQNLSASRKQFLKVKFTHQKEEFQLQLKSLSTEITQLKKELIEKHMAFAQQKKKYEQHIKFMLQMDELKKSAMLYKTEIESAQSAFTKQEKNLTNIKKEYIDAQKKLKKQRELSKNKLNEDALYQQRNKELKATNEQLNQLKYDQKKHEIDLGILKQIEQKIEQLHTLQEQIALQTERKKQIDTLAQSLEQAQKQKQILDKALEHYQTLHQQEVTLLQQEQRITAQKEELQKEKENLLQKKGGLENQREKLKQLKTEYQKQKKEADHLNQQAEDYHEIATATSKNGIQALLIENAIPEVEQEANHLLSRLTNNNAQIFIESLRDLQKGGTKETLDIKISDAAGIRAYELFSGGEAFRIDFALRIAISKLLARRSGTALQTLIIDEGFGSQDEEGLSQIMDAIHKIQEDFSKIIVVSHLTSMKDQFPVHFIVEKGANGSRINIFELG